jgi:hypothetical protein
LAREVLVQLLHEAEVQPTVFEQAAFYLKARERFQDKVQYCLHYVRHFLHVMIIPNAKDQAVLPIPGPLSFLYYLLRPLRLLRKYALHPRELTQTFSDRFRGFD